VKIPWLLNLNVKLKSEHFIPFLQKKQQEDEGNNIMRSIIICTVRFEVLIVIKILMLLFWVVMQLVSTYESAYCHNPEEQHRHTVNPLLVGDMSLKSGTSDESTLDKLSTVLYA
jgi:hypothetical protein